MAIEKDEKETIEKDKKETINISVDKLNSLLDRIEKLEKKDKPVKTKRITEHTAQIREWEGCLVVSYDKVFERFNPGTGKSESIITLNVITPDKKSKKIEAGYVDFLNNATVCHAKILKQTADEKEHVQGSTYITPTDEVEAKRKGLSYGQNQVDLIVKSYVYTSEVEMIDGNFVGYKFEVNNKYLNI